MTKCTAAAVLATLTVLAGCERPRIHGVVKDAFGRPLSGVDISVTNSAFRATTAEDGTYSLDYAPGQFTVTWAKPEYTTIARTFQISEKTAYPVDTLVLYPIPTNATVFWIGPDSLVPLTEGSLYQRTESGFAGSRERFTVEAWADRPLPIPVGRLALIDRTGRNMSLVRLDNEGLAADLSYPMFEIRDNYNGWRQDSVRHVGAESLLVRSAPLPPGVYAFVGWRRDPAQRLRVIPGYALGFEIVDSSDSTRR